MTAPAIFPSLTRDEVFRLETPRLWLRWPTVADAMALRHWVGKPEVATMTSTFEVGMPLEKIREKVMRMRARNSAGRSLGFVMVPQGDDDTPIGMVGVGATADGAMELGYHLNPALWGQGLMTEAVERVAGTVFALSRVATIDAYVRPENVGSRRVLEKCDFISVGTTEHTSPIYGTYAVKRYTQKRSAPSPFVTAAARHAPLATPLGFQLCGLV
jgi:RimJ/RimL family protein N-acetyltransferase